MVYSENLSPHDIIEEHVSLKSINDRNILDNRDNSVTSGYSGNDVNELQTLFHAAMILRNDLRNTPGMNVPWPPLASDITVESFKKVVPVKLYNFLTWLSGFSEDAQIDSHICIKEGSFSMIMAIAQDIVYVSSNSSKITPKSIALAMALRQMTGSFFCSEACKQPWSLRFTQVCVET